MTQTISGAHEADSHRATRAEGRHPCVCIKLLRAAKERGIATPVQRPFPYGIWRTVGPLCYSDRSKPAHHGLLRRYPMHGSEQGFPTRNSIASRESLWAQLGLPQYLIAELLTDEYDRCQADLSQQVCRPTPRCIGGRLLDVSRCSIGIVRRVPLDRRLRHNQPPSFSEEWCCTLGNHRRRTERSDDDSVEHSPEIGVPPADLGSLLDNPDMALKATGDNRPLKKVGAALTGVQQHELCLRPFISQDETGKTSSGPKVQDEGLRGVLGLALRQIYEPLRVKEMAFNRSRAQKPELARSEKCSSYWFGNFVVVGSRHRRLRISRQER
jgi:hypothetical protein